MGTDRRRSRPERCELPNLLFRDNDADDERKAGGGEVEGSSIVPVQRLTCAEKLQVVRIRGRIFVGMDGCMGGGARSVRVCMAMVRIGIVTIFAPARVAGPRTLMLVGVCSPCADMIVYDQGQLGSQGRQ